jgi:MFS family permease
MKEEKKEFQIENNIKKKKYFFFEKPNFKNFFQENNKKENQINLTILIIGLILGLFLPVLDITVVVVALPTISREFGNSNQYFWIVVSYLLTSTAFGLLYGRLSDVFGRKNIYIFATIIFLTGSLLCGVSVNMIMLIICRAYQGIGGGGLINLVFIIIVDVISMRERGKYSGILGATIAFASLIGNY